MTALAGERRAEQIHAQNVHDYFYKHWKEHGWEDLRNFVCSRPPFPKLDIIYNAFAYDGQKRQPDIHTEVLINEVKGIELKNMVGNGVESAEHPVIAAQLETFLQETRPEVMLGFQSEIEGYTCPGVVIVVLDALGRVLVDSKGQAFMEVRTKESNEHFSHVLHRDMMIALATINFMNCKNVELVDNPPSRQARRYAERTNQPPPVTYKTLVLHPFGKRNRVLQRSEAGPTGNTALHIVRGHFKDYRGGEGLGRAHAKGLWWWSPQVRGTNPERVVEKDYAVEAQ